MIVGPDLHNDRQIDHVTIGRGTYFGSTTDFRSFSAGERIIIGRYCSLAEHIIISAGGNHRPELVATWPFDNFMLGRPNPTRTYRPADRHTTIGSDVWIGDGAHIGAGVQVGDGAVIGAAAVVFKDVPPYAVVVGNPARTLRYRFTDDIVAGLLAIQWWNWPAEIVRQRLEWFYRPVEAFVAEFAPATRAPP